MDTGFVSDKSKNTGRRENSARGRDDSSRDRTNSANRPSRPFDRRDQSNRRDGSRDRPPYGPCAACGGAGHSAHYCHRRCKFCKQVHEVGQCELFRRYEKLAALVKNTVDKSNVPDELQDLYTPGDLKSAARQH
ncbi:hypothetical protein PI124_g17483 [Phytophthora idaei]|nr:hypothetical protein PI125_g6859 [Phytophthora idaei]KAG3161386.1 hypothetical protein PI126_g6493 [Phytophthora idaei]KAG3237526.1 hypothetical protein PI124_g17483 [Phytophthora idaei]